ncbi:Zn-dependent hydrolase [Arthrobacter pigmenti]
METVSQLLDSIDDVGRDPRRGGYSRPVFSEAELDLRSWFIEQAQRRGLDVETDRNGAIWAWWGSPSSSGPKALVTGSHLDSVPGGGAFDGPLGVASALAAVDKLRARGITAGEGGTRPLGVTVFPEEEGSRFGVACLGSRLMSGAIDADRARSLTDADGITFAEAAARNGLDPEHLGADPQKLDRVGQFVELHVEQGRGQIDLGPADGVENLVAIGTSILGHGRWKFTVSGQGNHAGTTLMTDRADPMIAAARIVLAVQQVAAKQEGARATIGRLQPLPGGTNVIASTVEMWMDVRHPDDAVTAGLVETIHGKAQIAAANEGCMVRLTEESYSNTVHLDSALQSRLHELLPQAPPLATGAGHDAGVLAAVVPSAMLFVRNPTGISHSPEEWVERDDADTGAEVLADVLEGLL